MDGAAVEVEVVDEAAGGAPERAAGAPAPQAQPKRPSWRWATRRPPRGARSRPRGPWRRPFRRWTRATAPPWTRKLLEATRTTSCASRRNGPSSNRRRGGARHRSRGARTARGASPSRRPRYGYWSPRASHRPSPATPTRRRPGRASSRRMLLETRSAAPSASRTKLERRSSRAAATVFARRASCATVRLTTSAAGSARAAPRRFQ